MAAADAHAAWPGCAGARAERAPRGALAGVVALVYGCVAAASEPLVGAAATGPVAHASATGHAYACGDSAVTVRVAEATLALEVDGEHIVLDHVPAASGAKYRDAHATLFWSHGAHALFELRGRRYPECIRAGTPAADLAAVRWVVEDIDGGGVIDRSRVTLEFDGEGRLSGHASCNRYTASYTRDGDGLTIGPAATTRMACPPALMNQERSFLDALAQVRRWAVDASGALVLAGENGDDRLVRARYP